MRYSDWLRDEIRTARYNLKLVSWFSCMINVVEVVVLTALAMAYIIMYTMHALYILNSSCKFRKKMANE